MTMPALGRKFPKTSVLKGETRHSGETGGFSIIKNIHTISSLLCVSRLNYPHMLVNVRPAHCFADRYGGFRRVGFGELIGSW